MEDTFEMFCRAAYALKNSQDRLSKFEKILYHKTLTKYQRIHDNLFSALTKVKLYQDTGFFNSMCNNFYSTHVKKLNKYLIQIGKLQGSARCVEKKYSI